MNSGSPATARAISDDVFAAGLLDDADTSTSPGSTGTGPLV
jgi:hypothetical protein